MLLPPVFLPYFRHLQCPNMTEGTEQEGPQLAGLGGARVALQGEEGVLGRPGWKREVIFWLLRRASAFGRGFFLPFGQN